MALWEFYLTETDYGKGNHNGPGVGIFKTYRDRRELAIIKAYQLGVTLGATAQPIPQDQAPDAHGHGVYYWLVDDPSNGPNVQALCCYFNTQPFVTTNAGYPRPLGGAPQALNCNSAQVKEGVARLIEISKALGDS